MRLLSEVLRATRRSAAVQYSLEQVCREYTPSIPLTWAGTQEVTQAFTKSCAPSNIQARIEDNGTKTNSNGLYGSCQSSRSTSDFETPMRSPGRSLDHIQPAARRPDLACTQFNRNPRGTRVLAVVSDGSSRVANLCGSPEKASILHLPQIVLYQVCLR